MSRRESLLLAIPLVAAIAVLSGCSLTGNGRETATTGKEIWLTAGCGACHVMAAAGTTNGVIGGNLDIYKPSYKSAYKSILIGGGQMPQYSDKLTAEQISTLAQYIADNAGKTPPAESQP